MAAQKIQEAIQNAKKSLTDAQRRFDSGSSSLQSMASRSIDIMGGTATSQVARIATESRRLCDALYAACQTQVKILDETCRPLLSDKLPVALIQDVWKTICLLNEESEITNNFTASFNDRGLGDLVTVQYQPSMECKMIEAYWEAKYKAFPGREAFEQQLETARVKKEKEKKNAAQIRKIAEITAYKDAIIAWEETARSITKQRQEALEKAVSAETARLLDCIEQEFEQEMRRQSETVDRLSQERMEKETLLTSLRFYQFVQKIRCQDSLADILQQLDEAHYAIEAAKRKFAEEKRKIPKTMDSKKESLQVAVNKKYPMPLRPRKPLSMRYDSPSPSMLASEGMKTEMLKTIARYGEISCSDLIKKCKCLDDLTLQRVLSYAESLQKEGEITITKQKVNYTMEYYFRLAY